MISLTAWRKPDPSRAPMLRPQSCSAALARPSRKNEPISMKLFSTALAARVSSPARAPCAVKNRNAAISAAVRIMMSRLIASMRMSLMRSNSTCAATRRWPPSMRQATIAPATKPVPSARMAAMAAPSRPIRRPSTSQAVAAMLVTLMTICSASAIPVFACPTSQPSST